MATGKNIKQLMQQRGFTQKQLAKLSNASLSYLKKIEQEKVKPSTKVLARIANALGVTINELREDDN
jgi:transcriptional regulator with XRE-family HTH domain